MPGAAASYGLQYHARSIAAQIAEQGASCWLAGTTVFAEENEIQLLKLDKEKDSLTNVRSFTHKEEIWSIVPSPVNPSQFVTTYTSGDGIQARLWSMPAEGGDLRSEADLSQDEDRVMGIAWSSVDTSSIAVVTEQSIRIEALPGSSSKTMEQHQAASGATFSGAADWSKGAASVMATASGSESIQIWDTRSMKAVISKSKAHASTIRCLDFAKGDSQHLASCGSDCKVKCRFNPSHDQLLLTGSSDATVKLHHIPKLGKSGAKPATEPTPGSHQWQASEASCCAAFDGHDDSIYGVAWSHVDPWTFASISYDGRVIIGRVPSSVKYSILI